MILVGKSIYLAITRPYISYAIRVSLVSQFMSNSWIPHMDAIICILKYVKGTPGRVLYKYFGNLWIEGYTVPIGLVHHQIEDRPLTIVLPRRQFSNFEE